MSNLDLRFYCDDLDGEVSIRDYLQTLLLTMWDQGEGFSGKRPFGNSGWDFDLYKPLVVAGIIEGTVDEDGYIDINTAGEKAGHAEVERLIREMCGGAA